MESGSAVGSMEALSKAERQEGGGVLRVDATPCRKVSRCPYAVARERGGNLRAMVWVNRGIPWIYPRERARRKVEREGEPMSTPNSVVVLNDNIVVPNSY